MWRWIVTYWRTLFNRQTKPFKPTYPVTAIQQPTPITKSAPPAQTIISVSAGQPLGLLLTLTKAS